MSVRFIVCAAAVLAVLLFAGCEQRAEMSSASPSPPAAAAAMLSAEATHPWDAPQSTETRKLERQVIARINQIRRQRGLPALEQNPRLMQMARYKSRDMAVRSYFDHTSPTGETFMARIRATGLSYRYVGENIFETVNMPASRVVNTSTNGWIHSPEHRANILYPSSPKPGSGSGKRARATT